MGGQGMRRGGRARDEEGIWQGMRRGGRSRDEEGRKGKV